tara:strand:- start:623 stop:1582 length:960 start_codon:yes stop_codon:yes gene_type:complete
MNEFQIIKKYFLNTIKNNPGAFNLNDDVFLEKKTGLVISVDTYNEGVHYLNFNHPNLLIKKIIRSSISDLICKGVNPKYIFISGSGNKKIFNKKNLKLLSTSLKQEQKKYNIKLSGGDTVFSNKSSFTIISVGYSKKIVNRNNVKINDDIYVTGNLGDSFVGLKILKKKIKLTSKLNNYFINKYFLPDLPVNLQSYLIKFANSSMDISDGLFTDLKKLINTQKCGFNIYLDLIPISINLGKFIKKRKHNIINYISRGDDYQILFTSSKKNRKKIKNLSKRINQKISYIGEITNQYKEYKIFKDDKLLKPLYYEGYLHKF